MNASTTTPDLQPLRSAVTGTVLLPGDEGWDLGRQAWNLAVDQLPAAVVFADGAADVAAAVRFAAQAGLRVTAQGTGHAAATHETLADTVLVKTIRMAAVSVDPEARTARVEAGVLVGDLAASAQEHGLAAVTGSSPDVGVIGFVLGGGLGWLGRSVGFACNGIRAVELVTADGEQVRVDAERAPGPVLGPPRRRRLVRHRDRDRGRPAPARRAVRRRRDVRRRARPEVFRAYREWARAQGREVTSSVRFLTPPPIPDVPEPIRGRPLVAVTAAYAGDPAEGERAGPLRDFAPASVMDMLGVVPAAALCRIHGDPEQPVPGVGGKSTVIAELADEAIDALVAVAGAGSGSPLLQVDLRHLGGALGTAPADAGVLGSLEGEFAIAAVGVPMGPITPDAIEAHLVEAARRRWSRGAPGAATSTSARSPATARPTSAPTCTPTALAAGQGGGGPARHHPRRKARTSSHLLVGRPVPLKHGLQATDRRRRGQDRRRRPGGGPVDDQDRDRRLRRHAASRSTRSRTRAATSSAARSRARRTSTRWRGWSRSVADPDHRGHPLQPHAGAEGDRRGRPLHPHQPGQHRRAREDRPIVVDKAKAAGVPIRIGVNSGSLPKHLHELERENSVEALVQAAVEYVELMHRLRLLRLQGLDQVDQRAEHDRLEPAAVRARSTTRCTSASPRPAPSGPARSSPRSASARCWPTASATRSASRSPPSTRRRRSRSPGRSSRRSSCASAARS